MSAGKFFSIEKHIGRTMQIRLRRLSELTGCEIWGAAEFTNPGGSVKDCGALVLSVAGQVNRRALELCRRLNICKDAPHYAK